MKKLTTTLTLLGLTFTGVTQAATLVSWDFNGLTAPGTSVAYPSSANADAATYASPLSGINPGSDGTYTRDLEWSAGNVASNELNLQNWDLTGTSASGTTGSVGDGIINSWLQFSLESDPSSIINITSISMSAWRNGTGAPEDFAWDYSLDNGTTWIDFGTTVTQSEAGDSTFRTSNFTGNVNTSDVLLRFAPTGGSGNIHIESFSVEGTVIPEPSSTILISLAGTLLVLRRRR